MNLRPYFWYRDRKVVFPKNRAIPCDRWAESNPPDRKTMITVLYVDDEPDLLHLGKLFLEGKDSMQVDGAVSVKEAMALLSQKQYDAIVSDYQMPEADGIGFLKRVRQEVGGIPFILFTGKGREEVVIEAINNGADFYLQKGGDPKAQFAELAHKIRQAVRRVEAEVQRKEAIEQYRNVVEDQTEFISRFLPDGTHLFVNGAYCRYFNKKREDFIGKKVLPQIHPDDVRAVREHFASLTSAHPAAIITHRIILPDGTVRWHRWSDRAIFDDSGALSEYQSVGRDVTEERLALEDLQFQNALLKTELEVSPDGILIVDKNRLVLKRNRKFTEIWGIPPSQAGTLSDEDLIQEVTRKIRDPQGFLSRVRYLYDHPEEVSYEQVLLLDGRVIERYTSPITGPENRYYGRIWYFRDITSRMRAEADLKAAHDQLLSSEEALMRQLEEVRSRDLQLEKSEEMLRLKLGSVFCPGYEIGDDEFENIIDKEEVQSMMDDFYSLTGIGIAIGDMKGRILVATGWQDICTKFHRVGEISARNCRKSDLYLTENVQPGRYLIYRCRNNMWDMVTPILIGEKPIGNLYLGQFFFDDELPDREIFRSQAEKFGFPMEEYLAALDRVPRWSREKVGTVMAFYTKLASMISRLGYSNLGLAKTLTEYQQVVNELALSEERFREYIEYSLEGVYVVDQDGRYLEVNKAACDLTGYTREELLSMDITCLVPPEGLLSAQTRFSSLKDEGRFSTETRLLKKDGSLVPVLMNTVRLPNETFIAFCSDITEQKKAEQMIRETNEKLRETQSIAHVGSWETDLSLDITRWSDETFRILGFAPGEVEPKAGTLESRVHPDDRSGYSEALVQAVTTGKYPSGVFRIVRPDGTVRTVQGHGRVVFDDSGRVVRIMGSIQDVSDQKNIENTLKQANRQISLLGSITRHDILNKVSVILGYLDQLGEEFSDPALLAITERIGKAVRAVRSQIDFTRVYQKIGAFEPVWQDLGRIITPSSVPPPVRFQSEVEDVRVFADPMLGKVFENLIDNSLRHGGTVTRIDVSYLVPGRHLVIVLEDDGTGIPEDQKERIFERGVGRNTGLGLFLVREVLALTGITIHETGRPGSGARFEITVPAGSYRIGRPKQADGAGS